jgi:hypothetical protein
MSNEVDEVILAIYRSYYVELRLVIHLVHRFFKVEFFMEI